MKIILLVILYHPKQKNIQNIQRLVDNKHPIIIVNNSADHFDSSSIKSPHTNFSNIHYINNKYNIGIAAALNQGVRLSANLGYEWCLTLDQDSELNDIFFTTLENIISSYPTSCRPAVIGSNYTDETGFKVSTNKAETCGKHLVEINNVITSGSLISIDSFKEIGPFCEKYFIDIVDYEYCIRARKKGYKVAITKEPLMKHSIGNLKSVRLAPLEFTITNHDPRRKYYIFRNSLNLISRYVTFDSKTCISLFVFLMKLFAKTVLFENNKTSSIKYIFLGIYDFFGNKYDRRLFE